METNNVEVDKAGNLIRDPVAINVTCALGSATSAEIDIGYWSDIAIRMPTTMTGFGTISFNGATTSGGTFYQINNTAGSEMLAPATQNLITLIGTASLAPFRYITVQFQKHADYETGTQAAARTLTVIGK
jgi:hypothetical protein